MLQLADPRTTPSLRLLLLLPPLPRRLPRRLAHRAGRWGGSAPRARTAAWRQLALGDARAASPRLAPLRLTWDAVHHCLRRHPLHVAVRQLRALHRDGGGQHMLRFLQLDEARGQRLDGRPQRREQAARHGANRVGAVAAGAASCAIAVAASCAIAVAAAVAATCAARGRRGEHGHRCR